MTKSKKKLALATEYMKAQITFRRKNAERIALMKVGVYGVVDIIPAIDAVVRLGYDFRAMNNPGSPFYIKG